MKFDQLVQSEGEKDTVITKIAELKIGQAYSFGVTEFTTHNGLTQRLFPGAFFYVIGLIPKEQGKTLVQFSGDSEAVPGWFTYLLDDEELASLKMRVFSTEDE